jgi:hypothetical protein
MKKILLTISRGWIARNLLQNDFYRILREDAKIYILSPAHNDRRFIDEFKHNNVYFIPLEEKGHTFFDRIIFFFHKNFIYNPTVDQKNRWGIIGDPRSKRSSYLLYIFKKIFFLPVSKLSFLRDFVRYIDYKFLQKFEVKKFINLIDDIKPDLVVITNIAGDTECALAKAAKKRKIKIIGIPKSWDNLSKYGIRAKADILILWNKFMLEEAEKYQNYKEKNLRIIGIPQFDDYLNKDKIWSRKKFCSIYNLDVEKNIIFFGSEGKLHQTDKEIAGILFSFIEKNELLKNCQLLIRPHFGYQDDELKFKNLFGKENVVVDLFNNPSNYFRDHWDYSTEFKERFINSIYHSDIIINTYSTLTLDGAFFNKPIICINFDGHKIKSYSEQTARWGQITYYNSIIKIGAVSVVNNSFELKEAINKYLSDKNYKDKERGKLREVFCYKQDGKSGQRLSEIVINELK